VDAGGHRWTQLDKKRMKVDVGGCRWMQMEKSGCMWMKLDAGGRRWTKLDACGYSWMKVDAGGHITGQYGAVDAGGASKTVCLFFIQIHSYGWVI